MMARQQRLLSLIFCITGIIGCSNNSNDHTAPPDPTAALTAADEALSNDELPSEEVIGAVLAIESESTDILLWLAQTSHSMGQVLYNEQQTDAAVQLFLKAGVAMQKAEESGKKLSSNEREMRGPIYYDQACAFSLLGQPEKALAPLRRAVEVGYGDIGLFDQDSDLDAVRELPQYPAFYAETLKFLHQQLAREMQEFDSYPLDFDLTDLDGKQLVLSEMKGKVVVLDFWATWCRPCLMSMPHLDEIYQAEKSRGLVVLGLNYEGGRGNDKTTEKVEQVLSDLKIHYPCAIGDEATEKQIPDMDSIPTMVFIDRTGKVRYQLSGAHSRDYLMAVIEPLLAEPVPDQPE